jgi:hypothetical protein
MVSDGPGLQASHTRNCRFEISVDRRRDDLRGRVGQHGGVFAVNSLLWQPAGLGPSSLFR